MKSNASSIVKNLQITFSLSVLLLVVSLFSSFFSVQRLIDNSVLVNHTNEVLIESENIISHMKDGETGQRGYLVTGDLLFLEPYNGSKVRAISSWQRVKELTSDSPVQQIKCERVRELIRQKADQMAGVIDFFQRTKSTDTLGRYNEMLKGKEIMDELRLEVNSIKTHEKKLLEKRSSEQLAYISSTRVLVVIAALISILISAFAYFKIKSDLDARIARQKEDERKYNETSERINVMESLTSRIAQGEYDARSTDLAEDELGRIGKALNNMGEHLQSNFEEISKRVWLQEGAVKLGEAMRGERNTKNLSARLIEALTTYLSAPVGAVYITNNNMVFGLTASHAVVNPTQKLTLGEGVVGQVLKTGKMEIIRDLPENFFDITSSTGTARPCSIIVLPLTYEGESIGVIEIGLMRQPEEVEIELLKENEEAISIAINAALDNQKLQDLLEETQSQSEELQAQHSELENLNSELEAQAQSLQASEEELKVQQEELQQINSELEERTMLLEEKNREIQTKAEQLALTTRYKSEFLANMSHELRTPLNSILLLSRLLSDNADKSLNSDQVEYARVIQSSGNGLLWLIDEILDLSKIEAGKMELDYNAVPVQEIMDDMKSMFQPMAIDKDLEFKMEILPGVPEIIETDKMRLEQILKNLLSNAIKFTAKGQVSITVKKCKENADFLCFSVKDTGIGIPREKQNLIFEAFQQADGSTKRKYGGTGLGLSISRELIKLLGGEIRLISGTNEGSEFVLYVPSEKTEGNTISPAEVLHLPVNMDYQEVEVMHDEYVAAAIPQGITDDRASIKAGENCILIVEDDVNFAKSLLEYTRKKGYKGIVSVRGDEGLPLALQYKPQGILLDIQLPVKSGWEVMEELKTNTGTRHIPVHIMSSHKVKKESLLKGAIDFIEKPLAFEQMHEVFERIEHVLSKGSKKVLIIEDNRKHAEALAYFLETFHINSEVNNNILESISALKNKDLDCVILDMGIPANNAYEILEQIKMQEGLEHLPIIIFTGKSLSMSEEQRIKKYADSIVIKTANSYQRMLDEVSLFLHLVEERKGENPEEYKRLGAMNEVLSNKTVLIADDDVRNIFSLSKALESLRLNVITSTDGKEAMQKLKENSEIDIVLLDMMMPEMDGYETARMIRQNPAWKKLPIIAVTAKAMTGDREKCINAGASDYITKPVDIDQLLSLLRVWLYDRN
jgi:signal transduction histidine kinase/CheY-like chemotaxis protein/CHASE3 domain sensor protein